MQNIDGMPLDISPGLVLHGQFRVGLWLCQAVRHCASGFRHPRAHTKEVSQHFPDPGEGSRERGMLLAWDFSSGMPWWSPKTQVVWEWLGQLFSQTELSNFVLTGSNRCGSTKYFRGSVEMLHRSHWRTPGRLQNAAVIPKTSWATSALESSSLSDFFCAVLFTRHLRKMAGWCFFFASPSGDHSQCAGEQIEGAVSCSRSLRVYSVTGTLVMDDGPGGMGKLVQVEHNIQHWLCHRSMVVRAVEPLFTMHTLDWQRGGPNTLNSTKLKLTPFLHGLCKSMSSKK